MTSSALTPTASCGSTPAILSKIAAIGRGKVVGLDGGHLAGRSVGMGFPDGQDSR